MCSEGLLSPGGRRLSLDEKQLRRQFLVRRQTLDLLVDERVLSREPRLGSTYYEISHDRLAEPVLKTRRWRMPRGLRRVFTGAALVIVVLLIRLAIVGHYNTQLEDAQQRLTEVSELTSSMVFELSSSLSSIDQVGLLEPLALKVDAYYANWDLTELTATERNTYASNLALLARIWSGSGRTEDAITLLDKSLHVFRDLADENPEQHVYRRNYAVTLGQLAELEMQENDYEVAKNLALEQVQVYDQLEAADYIENVSVDYAYSADLLGRIEKALGNSEEARAHFERQQALLDDLLLQDPDNSQHTSNLAFSHMLVGDLDMHGDLTASLNEFELARTLCRDLAERIELDTDLQLALGAATQRIGDVYLLRLEVAEAKQAFAEVRDLFRKMQKNNPESIWWQRNVGVGLERLAQANSSGVAEANSLMSFVVGMRAYRQQQPVDPSLLFEYLRSSPANADLVAAEAHYSDAADIFWTLADKDPNIVDFRQDLAYTYDGVSRIFFAAGDIESARRHNETARALADELLSDGSEDLYTARLATEVLQTSGRQYLLLGNAEAAARDFEQAMQHIDDVLRISDGAQWQAYKAEGLDGLGDAHVAMGNLDRAVGLYTEAHGIRSRLAAPSPENLLWQIRERIVAFKLAQLGASSAHSTAANPNENASAILDRLGEQARPRSTFAYTLQEVRAAGL
jgi:tetratricopeptide (TPR) repeat protein